MSQPLSDKSPAEQSSAHAGYDSVLSSSGGTPRRKRSADGQSCGSRKRMCTGYHSQAEAEEQVEESSQAEHGHSALDIDTTMMPDFASEKLPWWHAKLGHLDRRARSLEIPERCHSPPENSDIRAASDTREYQKHQSCKPHHEPNVHDVAGVEARPRPPRLSIEELMEEVSHSWFLNSTAVLRVPKKEKFFITYIQSPDNWRRVTLTWHYRNVQHGSLEKDLQSMALSQDKHLRIYRELRPALATIEFFDTVTKLRLETQDDGQLHITVVEDRDELFSHPHIEQVNYMHLPIYPQSAVRFESHISGYVYRVRIGDTVFIKKDLPRSDSIDEFLYEVNALYTLRRSPAIATLHGIVTNDAQTHIKAILLSYATEGSVADILYNQRIPWPRRLPWARATILGLAHVHAAGFVQGDMTVGNIVVDDDDRARLIDFNRRGCPIGWEPPELARVISRRQRVGMLIGVKSDLFQLGMCLFGLAEGAAEPERLRGEGGVLPRISAEEVPEWYRDIVRVCLSEDPRDRLGAEALLRMFDEGLAADGDTRPWVGREVDEERRGRQRVRSLGSIAGTQAVSLAANDPLEGQVEYICADGEEDTGLPTTRTAPDWGLENAGEPSGTQGQSDDDFDLSFAHDCDRFLL